MAHVRGNGEEAAALDPGLYFFNSNPFFFLRLPFLEVKSASRKATGPNLLLMKGEGADEADDSVSEFDLDPSERESEALLETNEEDADTAGEEAI